MRSGSSVMFYGQCSMRCGDPSNALTWIHPLRTKDLAWPSARVCASIQ